MKIILYFVQFCLILILFLIFKLIGYKKASNLGSKIGRAIGEAIKSDKVIIQNLNTVKKNTNLEIKDERKFVDDVFSNYGRILSDYVFLKKFKNGEMEKYINIKGREHLDEIKEKNKNVVFISGHFNNF